VLLLLSNKITSILYLWNHTLSKVATTWAYVFLIFLSESLTSFFDSVIIATPGVDTAGAGGVDGEPLQDVRNVLSHIEDMIETELNKNSSGTSTPVGEAGTPMEVEESKPDVRTQDSKNDKTGTQSQLDEEVANLLKLSPSVLHKELIEKCRLALETCIRRFPTHYKSHYRLAYLYMHSPYHQVPVSSLCSSISLHIYFSLCFINQERWH